MISCHLHALGTYLPTTEISNDDIARLVDTNDQWIIERTGIHCRRQIDDSENTSDLGIKASLEALKKAAILPADITHIIAATCTPDYLSPSVACIIGGAIGAGPVMAFDIEAACAGFIYGLSICNAMLAADPNAKILFICTEALTRRLNWRDRSTCVLFGDAACAGIFTATPAGSICSLIDVICQSDGKQKDIITVGGGTACHYEIKQPVNECFFLAMQGRETYKQAVRRMVEVCEQILKRNNLSINDIDLFVPHQANLRIIEAVGSRLKIAANKVFTNVANYGNTSAASIPLAIAEALKEGLIKTGAKILVTAFGAGLTWGAALLEFNNPSS